MGISGQVNIVEPFVPAALAASDVGTWDYEVEPDRCRGDATFARLFGLTPAEASKGVPMARIGECLHPEDRARGQTKRMRMLDEAGLFVIEYRTLPRPGVTRWVLGRGRYERDQTGRVTHGRGIVIDVTDSKEDGYVEGEAFFTSPVTSLHVETALERTARLMISTRKSLSEARGAGSTYLCKLMDTVLMEIGRQLSGGGGG